MFIILEWNGLLPEGFLGAMINEDGQLENFTTEEEAQKFADTECAFEYRIVEL
jgi:hypothetical protein